MFLVRGCGVVVSTSEHHAEGMGSNPTPRKLFSFSSARGRIYLLAPRFRRLSNSTGKRFQIGQQMKFSKYSKKISVRRSGATPHL